MVRTATTVLLTVVILLLLLVLYGLFQPGTTPRQYSQVRYSDFIQDVSDGKVLAVTMRGSILTFQMAGGRPVQTTAPHDEKLVDRLLDKGVSLDVVPDEDAPSSLHYFLSWLPLLIITGIWLWGFLKIGRELSRMRAVLTGRS